MTTTLPDRPALAATPPAALPRHRSVRATILFVVLTVALVALTVFAAGRGQLAIPAHEVWGSILHRLGLDSVGGVDGLLERLPAIANTPAGQHRRIVDMQDSQVLSFGPRTAEVLNSLAVAIYAPESVK